MTIPMDVIIECPKANSTHTCNFGGLHERNEDVCEKRMKVRNGFAQRGFDALPLASLAQAIRYD